MHTDFLTLTPTLSQRERGSCVKKKVDIMRAQFSGLLLALTVCLLAAGARAADSRPNIVIIMADDMGYSDLGCYGSEIRTPHVDRLAEGGLRFTQFYNTARCCPTRAALLTGLYSHQAGVGHMVRDDELPGYRGHLSERCVTIAEVLSTAGYRTLMSGKWHVGEKRPHWPVERGFDRSFGLISGGTNYFRLDPGRKMAIDSERYNPPAEGFYITDWISDHAAEMIRANGPREEPFFLYVAYTAPHWPLHALPEDIERYRGKYLDGWDALRERRLARMVELGLIEEHENLSPRHDDAPAWDDLSEEKKKDVDLKMAVYAAQIDRMDQGIGNILAALDETGERENTLVLFLCDNGGCAEEVDRGTPGVPPGGADSFLSYGLPWANASNTPFRLFKHWVHEGGISTPLVASWPAVIREPQITNQPGHVIDLMATCVDLAEAQYPASYQGRAITPLEGKSLRPIFEGKTREGHEAIFWEHEGNQAVRQGKWKLVSRYLSPWELYDLEADRAELNNLAALHSSRVEQMAERYGEWAQRAGVVPWREIRTIRRGARRP